MAKRNLILALTAAAALALVVARGFAEPKPPRADDPILEPEKYAAVLNDESFAARQSATAALTNINTLTPDQVLKLASTAKSLEAVHRLHRVARHHLVRRYVEERYREAAGPQGCLGVALVTLPSGQAPADRPAVGVSYVYPGFPAAGKLEVGDRIVAVDGQSMPAAPGDGVRLTFINMIIANQPGAIVRLTVIRDDKEREVRVKLASMNALTQIYQGGVSGVLVPDLAGDASALDKKFAALPIAAAEPLTVDLSKLPAPDASAGKSAAVPAPPPEPKAHPDDDGADE